MANSRPVSISSQPNSLYDEIIQSESKNIAPSKETSSLRSSTQPKSPVNHFLNENSSSSSIDSTSAKNAMFNDENKASSQINSNANISWTTTDSDIESEQDERYNNNNNSPKLNNVPIKLQRQQTLSRCDSDRQKNQTDSQELLSRRVKHFQKLFKSEIHEEMPQLIDSYVCAYQGDILLQGKMYITNRYLCFHSRIISYVTKHVYRWEQIENVTKERVAFIFPTAIGIKLKHSGKKIIYASFLQRDQAFDKIYSMCLRLNNDSNSLQDDDDNRLTQGGTLKAVNSNSMYNEKLKSEKRDMSFDMADGPQEEDVLQMCLRSDASNNNNNSNNKRRQQPKITKVPDNKQSKASKQLSNTEKNKSLKNSSLSQTAPKNLNESVSNNSELKRSSLRSTVQENEPDPIQKDNPVAFRRLRNRPLKSSRSRERSLSPPNRAPSAILSTVSSTSSTTNSDVPIINSNTDGITGKYSRIIILSVISIVKLIMAYLLSLFNRFKTYPVKTSLILLICITILIVHSFYLINLAYRIENRLQSLHSLWPSSSLMKNSRQL